MWAAEVNITIRRMPDQLPDQPAEETYYIDLGPVPVGTDADAIADVLGEITYKATGYYEGFALKQTKDVLEWGASHGAWTYLVDLAAHLDEVAIGIAVAEAFDKIRSLVGSQPELGREGALSSAQWAVFRHDPSMDRSSLELVSEEHDKETNRWTFGFRPGNGWEYTAEVGWHGKLPGVVRVKRKHIED